MNSVSSADQGVTASLMEVGKFLEAQGYSFTAPTPATHQRVNERATASAQAQTHTQAHTLRDFFGWSRAVALSTIPEAIAKAMEAGELLQHLPQDQARSLVRFSSLEGDLYAHSSFPTDQPDAVFFGPDTYRFAALIQSELDRQALPANGRILDVGCGAGPGGIVAAKAASRSKPSVYLSDINDVALQFAQVNAALAGVPAKFYFGDMFAPVEGEFDLIVSNPPYLNDSAERTYRHGGGEFGEALSQRIVREGLERLTPHGRLVLYTGVAILEGRDPFIDSLRAELEARGWPWHYRELDPDVFGEELELPAYARADRIAATALTIQRPAA